MRARRRDAAPRHAPQAAEYAQRDGRLDPDAQFLAEENARVVVHAERYYRTMFQGRVSSWNLRDEHMADALEAVAKHAERSRGKPARIVVWAHNSHLGHARATYMRTIGELNLGQIVRERHPRETVGIGFTTFHGTVTAARDWDGPAEHRLVRDALHGSWERALHALGAANLWGGERSQFPVAHKRICRDSPPSLYARLQILFRLRKCMCQEGIFGPAAEL